VRLQPTVQKGGNHENLRKLAPKPGTSNLLDRQCYRSLFGEGHNILPEGRKINSGRN